MEHTLRDKIYLFGRTMRRNAKLLRTMAENVYSACEDFDTNAWSLDELDSRLEELEQQQRFMQMASEELRHDLQSLESPRTEAE